MLISISQTSMWYFYALRVTFNCLFNISSRAMIWHNFIGVAWIISFVKIENSAFKNCPTIFVALIHNQPNYTIISQKITNDIWIKYLMVKWMCIETLTQNMLIKNWESTQKVSHIKICVCVGFHVPNVKHLNFELYHWRLLLAL